MKISGDGNIVVGKFCDISPDVEIVFLNTDGQIQIGDYCQIGSKVKIIVTNGRVSIDDWTTIHDSCLLLCSQGIKIGQHCWFGQHSVLDGTGGLTIGNSVRVGMYSQIWTHVAAGEQFEGCFLKAEKPVFINDNVWLVGSCICSPGVTLGKFSIALSQSNITKSVSQYQVVAGAPAVLKSGLNFYKKLSLAEKFNLLISWLQEFKLQNSGGLFIELGKNQVQISDEKNSINFLCSSLEYESSKKLHQTDKNVSVDLSRKVYTKKYSTLEKRLFKFLSNNKVRFIRDDCE